MARLQSVAELEKWRQDIVSARDPNKPCITVCGGTGCRALEAQAVADAFRAEVKAQGLEAKVDVKITGCHGFCERGPLVVIFPERIFYPGVAPKHVPDIVSKTIAKGEIIESLLYEDPATGQKVVHEYEVPFYKLQDRVLMDNNGLIDPTKIEDYIAVGGYKALAKVLFEMTPDQVIEEIKRSGLRGRGGAGFPTGRKWADARHEPGDVKYVIINADEGDPGAYQDRSLVEGNPHSILEGLIIGAYAVGAHQGFIYIRHEYPMALQYIMKAAQQAEERGLIGKNILGSGFDFTFALNEGAGAFVCGESSALMRSMEGLSGEPRAKRIHATEKGLWDKPTVLNNVKTWAAVPHIIGRGADWFASIGTKTSKGTMIFSLVGKVNNTGLVEVPMGITVRRLVNEIGGGLRNGKQLKAVQTGGPSGGCLPESLADTPVDYESLTAAGSMMGSGAMIVMDEDTCMVDTARYFMHFNSEESCGKCTACREGAKRMYDILEEITHGRGKEEDLQQLELLARTTRNAALCALGRTAPNPVLTTMRYFRDEYEAHIKDKKCPAGVCKDLITFSVIAENCTGCGVCKRNCPQEAISGEKKQVHVIDEDKCIRCGICREVCKFDAIKVE
jgi:NADH:ubiquinone oxidoreductase subunit F (NADH-binding)/(2Fe-2S) ferredoxin/Pyruvate/2-oxoacid:ferredoxin oxidoreductase delta subunit